MFSLPVRLETVLCFLRLPASGQQRLARGQPGSATHLASGHSRATPQDKSCTALRHERVTRNTITLLSLNLLSTQKGQVTLRSEQSGPLSPWAARPASHQVPRSKTRLPGLKTLAPSRTGFLWLIRDVCLAPPLTLVIFR